MRGLDDRRIARYALIPIAIVAVVLRLPIALSRAPLGYDDGVYLASTGAMRAGGVPFVDVYSSQGPAFLPLLWLADVLGLRADWAPRLLPLLAGVTLTVAVYQLALRLTDGVGAAVAAALVATSGSLLYSTTRIESDGVAMALAAGAVLAAAGRTPRRDVMAAGLLGLAVAVKSLLVAPAAVAILWLVWRRRGWGPAALVGAGAAALVVLLSVPWGLGAVWDQAIVLHLEAADGIDLDTNLELMRLVFRHRDRVLLGMAAAAVAWSVLRAVTGRPQSGRQRPSPPGLVDLHIAVWIWLVGSTAVLLLHQPLFLQHLAIVVPPAALLIAMHRPPLVVFAIVVALLLPSQASASGWRATRLVPSADERSAIDLLGRIEPRSGKVISDAPALVWFAGRTSPGSVVDASYVRINAGQLTTADVVAAATEPGVCGVLFGSGRLSSLPGLRGELTDYRPEIRIGDQELWLREGCRIGTGPAIR